MFSSKLRELNVLLPCVIAVLLSCPLLVAFFFLKNSTIEQTNKLSQLAFDSIQSFPLHFGISESVTEAPQEQILQSECSPMEHRQMHQSSTFNFLSTQGRHPAVQSKVMSELKGGFLFLTGNFFINQTSPQGILLSWRGSIGFTLKCFRVA